VSVAVAAVGALGTGCGDEESGEPKGVEAIDSASAEIPPQAAGAYYVGPSFEDLPLTDVLVPPGGAGDSTSFIYGDCEPPDEGGCAPPLEIQTWSICDRLPSGSARSDLVSFRGAKALFDPAEEQAEIYAGRKTIVIFATQRELRRHAAKRVQPAGEQADSADLPSPPLAAIRGRLHCQPD
jgi:hypothetical protein